ncbi:dihydroanticapsin 7-dehydrogenase [Paraliobacillus ryukyuensis]|uniref:NAD(P)-dependent dehydrogenase (Short-subunit alcohol dehydrogenase family) n=1 Tax=Paraliobacillus ryukyuensis TaxID=200904 RepID=A0A366EEA7_9BACI|nr:NAD(P)-dependent dehydrogenase (short-subunit alcohol dehydrogenase family) [Paraliobacillus ryukyuensis]
MDLKNLFSLKGEVALVTGGAGIIGSAVVEGLAYNGATVIVADIDLKRATDLANKINEQLNETTLHPIKVDITDEDSIKSMVNIIVKKFKKIDILHNNAAGKSNDLNAFFEKFEKYSLDQWNEIMNTDITSMFLVAREVGNVMSQQSTGGSIIQTSSIYGIMAPDNRIYEGSNYLGRQINTPAIYSTAKAGVIGLTKYLATYWADKGIRVNSITPGGVESGQNEQFIKNYSNRVPLGRMAKAEDMVGAIVYLASNASSYVTGQNLIVDGGLSAW